MTDKTVRYIMNHIKGNEDAPEYPYADNKGKVTGGAGFLVDTKAEFSALPFKIKREDGSVRDATAEEKVVGFKAIKKRFITDNELVAEGYKKTTALFLMRNDIDTLLETKVTEQMARAKKEINNDKSWNKLTDAQKAVAVDIHYANGSLKKFEKYKEAIQSGDVVGMARESHFYSGEKDGKLRRNWKRIRANHCGALGLEGEACTLSLGDHYRGKEDKQHNFPADWKRPDEPEVIKDKEGKSLSPEAEKFISDVSQPGGPVTEAMLKDPGDWSSVEVQDVQKHVLNLAADHPDRAEMFDAVQQYYGHVYSNDPVRRDETGRMIQPEARVAISDKTTPPETSDGEPLDEDARRIGTEMVRKAGPGGTQTMIRDLQAGLNLINADSIPRRPLLKNDGSFGPKTRDRFRSTLARQGRSKLEEGLALGKFRSLAEGVRKTGAGAKVKGQTEAIFGPLFRDGDDRKSEKVEAVSLQETLNDVTDGRVEKLKIDGNFGPKTRDAFMIASKLIDPDELSKRYGQMLGFLG
jgi:hypothetical protein